MEMRKECERRSNSRDREKIRGVRRAKFPSAESLGYLHQISKLRFSIAVNRNLEGFNMRRVTGSYNADGK